MENESPPAVEPSPAVDREEATLCFLSRPTDRPTLADTKDYLSIRVTVGHNNDEVIRNRVLDDNVDFIMYKHGSGSNEHYHICIPGCTGRDGDKYRNRIKRHLSLSGPGKFSVKGFDNGVSSFVFYASHEGTKPIYENEAWKEIIEGAGSYEKRMKRKIDHMMDAPEESRKKRNWTLTYSNLVVQAVNHSRQRKQTFSSLKMCVKDMIKTSNWRPSCEMIRKGVPTFYEEQFKFETGEVKEPDMEWWTPK